LPHHRSSYQRQQMQGAGKDKIIDHHASGAEQANRRQRRMTTWPTASTP
jgi:hypothetical protein